MTINVSVPVNNDAVDVIINYLKDKFIDLAFYDYEVICTKCHTTVLLLGAETVTISFNSLESLRIIHIHDPEYFNIIDTHVNSHNNTCNKVGLC